MPKGEKTGGPSLAESLRKLESIVAWFDEQEDVDVEKGLEKVREGAALIKESRKRISELENEFEAVKADLEKADA